MSGFLAITAGAHIGEEELGRLTESIDLSRSFQLKSSKVDPCFFAVTSLPRAPVRGERLFESDRWIVLFSGDVVECESPPFGEIIASLETGKNSYFTGLNGIFGVAAYDKEKRKLYIVSDRRSQHPVFYYVDNVALCVSTDLSTFCRLKSDIQFNEKWLWEYLFFNYPVGDSTFLRDVRRMPPASILEYELNSGGYSIH